MSTTCHHCGQPVPGDGPGSGMCPPCLWKMANDQTVMVVSPVDGLPGVEGHVILSEIARGGMGIVYKAKQIDPEREVALKMLLPLDEKNEDLLQRFRVEVHALAELDHPGILPLYQVGSTGGRPWFTMKLASGGTLASRLGRRRKPFDPHEAAKLMASMADAVHHAHSHGFLHRDIKPANILFDERGDAFLADFGLAKLLDSTGHVTRSHAVLGTPCYMAPEVASKGAKAATTASDIYGLGAVLYELLSGRPPFMVEGMAALVKKIVEDEPERPSTLVASVPRDLELVCLTCLAKDPRQRYATAKDAADDLRRWLNGEPVAARRAGTIARLCSWARRRPALAALSAALVVSILTATILLAVYSYRLDRALADEKESRTRADEQSEFLIGRFADDLEKIGRLSLIEEACAKAETYDQPRDDAGHKRRARLLLRWAAVNWAKGDATHASMRLREVVETMDALHRRVPADATAFTLALTARCRLAVVLADTASFDESHGQLDAAHALVEKPGALPLDEALRMRYEIDRARAEVFTLQETEKDQAMESAKLAAQFCRTWQGGDPGNPARTLELAIALRENGKAIFNNRLSTDSPEERSARLEKALTNFSEARDLMEPLACRDRAEAAWEFEYAQDIGWMGAMLRRQAIMHREAGRTEEAQRTAADAEAALLTEQEILSRLSLRDSLNWYWRFKLSDTHWALGEFYEDNGDPARAKEQRDRRHELLAQITRQGPEVRTWLLSKQGADLSAGGAALDKGDRATARDFFKQALDNGLKLVTRQPDSRSEQDGWGRLVYGVAQKWLEAGDGQEAVAVYKSALKTCETQAAAGHAAEWWQWTAGWLERRLAVTLASADHEESLQANLRSFRHRADLLRARWFRALEDPAAIPNSFKEAERLQRSGGQYGEALKLAGELLDLYVACRSDAGPPLAWARPLLEVVDACIKPTGPENKDRLEAAPARLLAARAAAEFFPPATRATLGPAEQEVVGELEVLAKTPP